MKCEKLVLDIETLRKSIQLDWAELSMVNLSTDERENIKEHIQWCILELKTIENELSKNRFNKNCS